MVVSGVAVKRGLESSYEEEMTLKAKKDAQKLDSGFKDGGQATLLIVQHLRLQYWL